MKQPMSDMEKLFKIIEDSLEYYIERYGWQVTSVEVEDLKKQLPKEILDAGFVQKEAK